MNEQQLEQRALDLGFFPVILDFPESCWEIIEQHEGDRPAPDLWMRHTPNVGDEIVFRLNSSTCYRGRIAKRGFQADSGLFHVGHEAEFYNFCLYVHLWIDQLTPCPNPVENSIWEEES